MNHLRFLISKWRKTFHLLGFLFEKQQRTSENKNHILVVSLNKETLQDSHHVVGLLLDSPIIENKSPILVATV